MLGIPLVVVHAVDDPGDWAVPSQESIQTKSVFRRLNLARVALANRAYSIAPVDAGLQEIDAAEKFQLRRIQQLGIERDFGQHLRAEDSLVAEVVNGQQGLDAKESRVAPKV